MGDCICVRRGDGPEGCGICNETGTTPDIAGLCERLRRKAGFNDPVTGEYMNFPINSDGHQAADTIERQAAELANCRQHWSSEFRKLSAESKALANEQAAEIERLRELLRCIRDTPASEFDAVDVANRIRAALTGEDA